MCARWCWCPRELALQIEDAAQNLRRYLPTSLDIRVAVGGTSINPQMMALRGGADLLVATPGRLLDLVLRNAARLASLETLVLDEADRMFSQGFTKELAEVLALLPASCQKLLFSATFPALVQALAERLLRDPERIEIDAVPTPARRSSSSVRSRSTRARALHCYAISLSETHAWPSVLVFVASRHGVEHLASKLLHAGFSVLPLRRAEPRRADSGAGRLEARRIRVIVATDLAGRGLVILGRECGIQLLISRAMGMTTRTASVHWPRWRKRRGHQLHRGRRRRTFRLIEKRSRLSCLCWRILSFVAGRAYSRGELELLGGVTAQAKDSCEAANHPTGRVKPLLCTR